MIKPAIFLLSVLPAVTLAGNEQLSATGYYHVNGLYEPGYVNYRFDKSGMRNTTGSYSGIGGAFDGNGVFEAGYVNYRYSKTSTGEFTGTTSLTGGYYNDHGVYEPAYVNYRFGPSGHVNKCATTDAAGTIDQRVC
jgi:hypothetical protein